MLQYNSFFVCAVCAAESVAGDSAFIIGKRATLRGSLELAQLPARQETVTLRAAVAQTFARRLTTTGGGSYATPFLYNTARLVCDQQRT